MRLPELPGLDRGSNQFMQWLFFILIIISFI